MKGFLYMQQALESRLKLAEEKIEQLQEELILVKHENMRLHGSMQKLELSKTVPSINLLKSQQILNPRSILAHDKIEYLIEHFDIDFHDNEFAYSLFEIIIYVLSSKKGMSDLNEIIQNTKVLSEIINLFYFKGDLSVNNERNTLSELLQHIKSYAKNSFVHTMKMQITMAKDMPSIFRCDRIKIQSILIHLLNDLEQFIDHDNTIRLDINFEDKYLKIDIGALIYQNNTLFKHLFKEKKLAIDNKDRVGLQLARKLIERIKGKIETSYEEGYYKFSVSLPMQVIK